MKYEFESDAAKSASNLVKHGIDFVSAQQLWDDPKLALFPAEERGERREMAYASYDGKVWTAIFVRRGHRLRIISVRQARNHEVNIYEQG